MKATPNTTATWAQTWRGDDTCCVRIRSYQPRDYAAIRWLFREGLLIGSSDPADHAEDLDRVEQVYLADPHDRFWVAEAAGSIVGMVAVTRQRKHVARVRRLRVAPAWRRSTLGAVLLTAALDHCREQGDLKLLLDTHVAPEAARKVAGQTSFQYMRRVRCCGRGVLEFYTNLYRQPPSRRPLDEAQPTVDDRARDAAVHPVSPASRTNAGRRGNR